MTQSLSTAVQGSCAEEVIEGCHWSFDYGPHQSEQVWRDTIAACLSAARDLPDGRLEYTVLSNFWKGRDGRPDGGKACIISRRRANGHIENRVTYDNRSTGELLELAFTTGSEALRPLVGEWSIETNNRADDRYRGLHTVGHLIGAEGRQRMQLTVNDRLEFCAATLPVDAALTCNWSLYGCLGELVAAGRQVCDLVEDLEKYKGPCRIVALETIQLHTGDQELTLHGHVLHGGTEPPSYWWLDERGRVAIMSNAFCTFVLG